MLNKGKHTPQFKYGGTHKPLHNNSAILGQVMSGSSKKSTSIKYICICGLHCYKRLMAIFWSYFDKPSRSPKYYCNTKKEICT